MSTQHNEFPLMTPAAQAAAAISLGYSIDRMYSVEIHRKYRRQLAAFLRQVIKEAGIWKVSHQFSKVIVVEDLEAIADNLHNPPPPPTPPPPPPTLAEAKEADLNTAAGKDVVRDFLASLGEGEEP